MWGLDCKTRQSKGKIMIDVSCLRGENDKNKNPGVEINLGWCECYEISLEPNIGYKVEE